MRISGTVAGVAGLCIAGAALIAVPAVGAISSKEAPPAPTPTPSAAPTVTVSPNAATTKSALKTGVAAYEAAVAEAGGAKVSMLTANGYSAKAAMTPKSDIQVATGAKTLPKIVRIKINTYVQLAGTELTSSKALRTKAGKPDATWTTYTAALQPTLNLWLTPVNLSVDVAGLTPGLKLQSLTRQPDGSSVITSDLYPEKIKKADIRAAFRIPAVKKPTKPGQYRVEFGLNPSGALTRITVITTGAPVQVEVTEFTEVKVTPPAPADTITPADVKKATAPPPTPTPTPTQ